MGKCRGLHLMLLQEDRGGYIDPPPKRPLIHGSVFMFEWVQPPMHLNLRQERFTSYQLAHQLPSSPGLTLDSFPTITHALINW